MYAKEIGGDGDLTPFNGEPNFEKSDQPDACGTYEKNPVATSEPQPNPYTQAGITLDKKILLAGGAGILLVGGLLGIAFSQLLGRKKD